MNTAQQILDVHIVNSRNDLPQGIGFTCSISNIDPTRPNASNRAIYRLDDHSKGMEYLRIIFFDGEAHDHCFVMFSAFEYEQCRHSIESVEVLLEYWSHGTPINRGAGLPEYRSQPEDFYVTFIVVQPELISMTYGYARPRTQDDINFLKGLRDSSRAAFHYVGDPF